MMEEVDVEFACFSFSFFGCNELKICSAISINICEIYLHTFVTKVLRK